jgi:AI-2E family transporter
VPGTLAASSLLPSAGPEGRYQQLENYLIAPRILRHTVSLSAAAVLLAALIGGTVLGLVGALMAIPVAAALKVVLSEQLHARDAASADSGAPEDHETALRPAPADAPAPADEAAPPPPPAVASPPRG